MTEPSSSSPALSSWLSTMLAGKSDTEILDLLDRMLTRLALCDDSKLQDLLSKLLPLSISSLSSNSQSVRTKVLEILSHVNKRVKHQQAIGLPLVSLWELYLESSSAPMVRNFCVVYIEMAIDRAPKEEKERIVPAFLSVISKLPSQHQEMLLRISIKVFGECYATQIDDMVAEKYKEIARSQDRDIFVDFLLHTLLYHPTSQSVGCPPGLSVSQRDRVCGKNTLTIDILRNMKLAILNVLESVELPAEHAYPLYAVACVDSQDSVSRRGEELLKKKASGANLEDTKLIGRLFLLFNGNNGADQIPQNLKVTPGSSALRVRLMSIFCRSIVATNSFPSTLQCIFGCIYGSDTTSRLKQLGMEFTVWVFKHARADQLKFMGPVILTGILTSLDSYSTSESDSVVKETKTFAYQAIGLLAGRMPQLFRDKTDMAVRLFDALRAEPQFLRSVIQDSTISLALAYKGAHSNVLKSLESFLLENSQIEQSEVRFCAIRWATSLFDLQHCPSRFICMLAAADKKLDIREMALEGLFPGEDPRKTPTDGSNMKYPKLEDMLDCILNEQPAAGELGDSKLPFLSATYVAVIKFLLKCFETDVKQKEVLEDSNFLHSVDRFCSVLERAMAYEGSVELHTDASKALITISSFVPQVVASRYADKVLWLKQLLGHVDLGTRESMAQLLGIASSGLPLSASSDLINDLISSIGGTLKLRFEAQHGTICALGYVTANCLLVNSTISDSLLQTALQCLVSVVNAETGLLASAALQALGHIGLCTPLPLLASDSGSADVLSLTHEALKKLISRDDIKAVQKIVIALGHICLKESNSSFLNMALDLIFSLCHSKVEDILFAAGEALAFLWGGVPVTAEMILRTNYSSLSAASNFLMDNISSSVSGSNDMDSETSEDYHSVVRDVITRKLFDGLLFSNRKEERCAGTVWLLSLTLYCGQHPVIQKLLPDVQDAFSHLIGEQNELTQELASQGLSIVYELGDASMKNNLVNALVGTLTGSGKRKRAVKLLEDSEVFQDGAIGESPTGGKLSTYKELCNLANEMGQPDLIYKFMDLANYQASMNSKRGAAFGFSKIAKYAGDAIQPYLSSLIPRLIRYQYDPDKNVQDAMVHIWKALVIDSKKTIDEHLGAIMDDLLIQCGSRLWRSREASCLAIADLIQGRKFDQVEKHLGKIWKAAFRGMDDIKETVRISADRLCRAVTSLTARLCDTSLTPVTEARLTMSIVLPLLLTEGILSKVDSIRKASIGVVTKLAKGSGVAIRPHLAELVCCMLESLSNLEDPGLNYVELHAAKIGIQAEKLENLRISMAKGSPMWETLDFCIEVVDTRSLELLVPRLAQLVRSGVGLNTRVGVATFISRLVDKVGVDIKSFASMLLKLLFPVVKDERSTSSKRAFANACAAVLKFSAPSQAQKLIEDTLSLQAGDRNDQISGAILLRSYHSLASDIIGGYRSIVVPVIFISRFEDDKTVSNLCEELWEENMGSERITLQLYMEEIVNLINEVIMASSWASKKRASQAISKLSEVLGEQLSPHHHILLRSLMKEVPGRLWEGKEAVLYALSALCTSCHTAISTTDPVAPNSILTLVLAACSKKNKKYREAAFSCLEQTVKAFNNPDFFTVVFPVLLDMCHTETHMSSNEKTLASNVKAEEDEQDNFSASHGKIISCFTSIIQVARVSDIVGQETQLVSVVVFSLGPAFQWNVKMSVFTLLKELSSRLRNISPESHDPSLHLRASAFVHELFHKVTPRVIDCIRIIKIGQVHVAASDCILDLLVLYKDAQPQHREVGLKNELQHLSDIEKNEEAKSLLRICVTTLESFEG